VTVSSTFDAYGNVLMQSMPHSSGNWFYTTTTYDALGRPVTVTAPDGTSTSYAYDGLETEVTDANGNITTTETNILGWTLSVTPKDADGNPFGPNVVYAYDELGNLLTATRGGAVVSMTYDNAGRKLTMDDPDMGDWSYVYDALGNLTQQTDARGCTTNLTYDLLNRLKQKTYSDCPTASGVTYYYDGQTFTFNGNTYGSSPYAIGRRTGAVLNGSNATAWTYDERGRAASEKKIYLNSILFTTSWTYNYADLPVTMTYPDGEQVTTAYTTRMLPITVTGDDSYVTYTVYDTPGRLTSRTLGNGVMQKYLFKPWSVDGGRLDKIVAGSGGWNPDTQLFTNTLQKLSYGYDDVGNVTQIAQIVDFGNNQTETQNYSYDSLNRALDVDGVTTQTEEYQYSAVGNLYYKNGVTLNYPSNGIQPHAATSVTVNGNITNTYGYDENGNQTERNIATPEGMKNYELGYDAENRLISVTGVDGTNFSAQFTYNADGQRVKSVVNGETIYFVGGYYEKKGSEITKYYFAGASRIAMRKYIVPQTTTLIYLSGDHLGSTSLSVDADTGDVVETRYKPWGEVRFTTTDKTLPTQYTFTGQYSHMSDSATDLGAAGFGLMFYQSRYYDPQLGRFSQADSIVPGGIQGLDRFAYVGNNPVRYVDPSGHSVDCAIGEYGCDAGVYTPPSDCHDGDETQFCLLNNGAFIDESHYGAGNPEEFWKNLRHARGQGPTPITLFQSLPGGLWFYMTVTVDIPGNMSLEELAIYGAGIWLGFEINFEATQFQLGLLGGGIGNHSSFETADIPSTYLAYVAEVFDLTYEQIVDLLGGGYASSKPLKGHSPWSLSYDNWSSWPILTCIFSGGCTEDSFRNSSVNLKVLNVETGDYEYIQYPDFFPEPLSNEAYIIGYDTWIEYK
jgi:RHS repeat-associated protein